MISLQIQLRETTNVQVYLAIELTFEIQYIETMRVNYATRKRPSWQIKRREVKPKLSDSYFESQGSLETSEPIFTFNSTFLRLNEPLHPFRSSSDVRKASGLDRTLSTAKKKSGIKYTGTAGLINQKIQDRIKRIISNGLIATEDEQITLMDKKPHICIDYFKSGDLRFVKRCQPRHSRSILVQPTEMLVTNTLCQDIQKILANSNDPVSAKLRNNPQTERPVLFQRPFSTMKYSNFGSDQFRRMRNHSKTTDTIDYQKHKPRKLNMSGLNLSKISGSKPKTVATKNNDEQILPWQLQADNPCPF